MSKTILVVGNFAVVELERAGSFRVQVPGGAGYNISVAARAAGCSCRSLGVLGMDLALDKKVNLKATLPGLNFVYLPGKTAVFRFYYSQSDDEPHITSLFGVTTAATKHWLANIESLVEGIDWVHLCCRAPFDNYKLLEAIVRLHGGPISVDFIFPSIIREFDAIASLVSSVHSIFLNQKEYDLLAKQNRMIPNETEIVVTRGRDGVRVYGGGSLRMEVQPPRVVKEKDSSGAGDTIVGAYAAGLLMGLSPECSMSNACELASLTVQAAGMGKLEQLLSFTKHNRN